MDLIDLDLVVAVADTGTITHGAARAHLSLPSASARVRGLERALGAALFDRGRRGVSPTPTGTLLLRHARAIGQAVERMRVELAEHADGYGATVRVLANTAATASLLVPAVTAFVAEHAEVRVDLEERPGQRIVADIAERRAELGIVADSVDLGGLETRTLRADPLVVVAGPNDTLARRTSVSYSEILDRTFVGLSTTGAFSLGSRPSYRVRLPSIDAVCHAVGAGVGIAILPHHCLRDRIANGSITTIDLDDRWAHRNLVVCFTADDELSTTARALRDFLARHPGG